MVAEKNRVCRFRQRGDDPPDRRDEAHVEHLVGFVEHEDLDLREVDVPLLHEVEQAAGRGDEDVDAARAAPAICGRSTDAAEDDGDGRPRCLP